PPYWGLRDYGVDPVIWGGDPGCEHSWEGVGLAHHPGQVKQTITDQKVEVGQNAGSGQFCTKCSAWLGQLGLEPTPELYVQHLVEIFREVRRVLRDDGTVWLNIGDSYAGSMKGIGTNGEAYAGPKQATNKGSVGITPYKPDWSNTTLKPKDLVGIPWMLAFALRADGWWLRSDIIWAKGLSFCKSYSGTVMPESVTDRPTKSHEYVFLLTKSKSYYYDQEAIREDIASGPSDIKKMIEKKDRIGGKTLTADDSLYKANKETHIGQKRAVGNPSGRNVRSVWAINPENYSEAHFAVYPTKLIEPMILAGTSPKACGVCGAPYARIVELGEVISEGGGYERHKGNPNKLTGGKIKTVMEQHEHKMLGFRPTCDHSDDSGSC
ncbi:unnamed protein product, partial [marine sediment metagenome]